MKRTFKSIFSVLLVMMMLVGSVLPASAASVGDYTYINTGTNTDYHYTSSNHSDYIRFMTIRDDDKHPVYCAEPGAGFTDCYYEVGTTASDSYWNSLNDTKKEGMALAVIFGYPTQSASKLGVTDKMDAYAATQAIVWEYASGIRTSTSGFDKSKSPWYVAIKGSPAETAYNKLITLMNDYVSVGGYDKNSIVSNNKIYMLASASGYSEQAVIYYNGKLPEMFGSIEVKKTDDNGKALAGAEFSVYDSAGKKITTIGPTDENGYAISKDDSGKTNIIPFGSYVVVETKFPANHTASGVARWQVTVNAKNNAVVTINAVNVPKKGFIIIEKEDKVTEECLAGAVFEAKNTVTGKIYTIGPTNEDGYAISDGGRDEPSIPYGTYEVYETVAPEGYALSDVVYTVTIEDNEDTASTGSSVSAYLLIPNEKLMWELELTKKKAPGYSSYNYGLKNAVYALYKDGELLKEYKTNENGQFVTDPYPAGKGYTLKEIKAPEGYMLDTEEHSLDDITSTVYVKNALDTDNDGAREIQKSVNEYPPGVRFYILKRYESKYEEGKFLNREEGAQFVAYHTRFPKYQDAIDFNAVQYFDICTTNENGVGIWTNGERFSRSLLIGKYRIEQIKTGDERLNFDEPQEIVITDAMLDGEDSIIPSFTFHNTWPRQPVVIEKRDAQTNKLVKLSDATFRIREKGSDEFITLIKDKVEYTEFTTVNGRIELPVRLPVGEYEVVEVKAPEGYKLNSEPIAFEVKEESTTPLVVTVKNDPLESTITISKRGIQFTSVKESQSEFGTVYAPTFTNQYLAGVEFDIIADEDIIRYDETVAYKKGDVVEHIVTNANGPVKSKALPLGKYKVVESKTLPGYVINKKEQVVELKNDGENLVVENITMKYTNPRAKADIKAYKEAKVWTTNTNGDIVTSHLEYKPAEGFTFGLFADEKLVGVSSDVVINKDTLVAVATSDANGVITFDGYLPFGKYYVKELAAPSDAYILSTEKYSITVDANTVDEDYKIKVELKDAIKNDPVTGFGNIKKVDADSNKPMANVLLEVKDADGKVWYRDYTNENGVLSVELAPGKYTAKEVKAPEGYLLNTKEYEFEVVADKTAEVVIENKPLKGTISIEKFGTQFTSVETADSTYGTVNKPVFTDIYLAGVEFEISAAEDIYSPDGTLQYKKGEVVETLTSSASGAVTSKELWLGKYNVTETKTLNGYKIDSTPRLVEVKGSENKEITAYTEKYFNAKSPAEINGIKKAIVWEKSENGDNVSYKLVEVNGVGFTFGLYAAEDMSLADGKDGLKADDLVAVATTGSDGKLQFAQDLPFGQYYVKELAAPEEHYTIPNTKYPVNITTTNTNGETIVVDAFEGELLNDFPVENIKILKIDSESKKPMANVLIEIKDADNKVWFRGFTDEKGEINVILEPGEYVATEVNTPEGYVINTEKYEFTVADSDVTLTIENTPVKGTISVKKFGSQFVSVKETETDFSKAYQPVFAEKYLDGAVFEIRANEDIYSPDGTLQHKNGEVVDTLTTTIDGPVTSKELWLGKYIVVETATKGGYKLDTTPKEVVVTNDGEKRVTAFDIEFFNDKATAEITGVKTAIVWNKLDNGDTISRETIKVPGVGFTFGLYTAEDISLYNGDKGYTKDTLVALATSDSEGNIVFKCDLPFGQYYVKELAAPEEHYTIPDTKYPLDVTTKNTTGETIVLKLTEGEILNDFPKYPVPITKTDLVTSEPVPDAVVEIYDAEGNVIYREITQKDGTLPNIVLEPGNYTFKEVVAPVGFIRNVTVFEFTVLEDGKIDGVVDFTNEPTQVTITKTDAVEGKPVAGAEITIYEASPDEATADEVGVEVYKALTDDNGQINVSYLEVGKWYVYRETKAANGFAVNKNIFRFMINEDGSITGDTTLVDDYTRFKVYKVDEDKKPMAGVVFTMYDEQGNPVDTATSDEAGIAEFVGFGEGSYTIKETKTLDGFDLAPDSIKITNDGNWDNDAEYAFTTVVNYKTVIPPQTGEEVNLVPFTIGAGFSFAVLSAALFLLFKKKETE